MQQIIVSSSPYQEQTFEFNGIRIRLTLRYNSVGQFWAMDVFEPVNQRQICEGVSLVCGVPLLNRTSQPYLLWVSDESGANLDPMEVSDLGKRNLLFIAEKT